MGFIKDHGKLRLCLHVRLAVIWQLPTVHIQFFFIVKRWFIHSSIINELIYLSSVTAFSWSVLAYAWNTGHKALDTHLHLGPIYNSQSTNRDIFGMWEETGKPSENPCRCRKNMQNNRQTVIQAQAWIRAWIRDLCCSTPEISLIILFFLHYYRTHPVPLWMLHTGSSIPAGFCVVESLFSLRSSWSN